MMKLLLAQSLVVLVTSLTRADPAVAGEVCSSVLTFPQENGFRAMFSPVYSAKLIILGRQIEENYFKRLSQQDLERLKSQKPTVVATHTLTIEHAKLLQDGLNEVASFSLPGWVSTGFGLLPRAWIGLTADILLQLLNEIGSTDRVKIANIAGTVTEGGQIAVLEQVATDNAGKMKFMYTFVYNYELNGVRLTTPLTICAVDILQENAVPSDAPASPTLKSVTTP